jgi:hypothetical protein
MNGSEFEDSNAPRAGAAGIADQVVATGRDLQSKAVDLAGASGEAIKEHASELSNLQKTSPPRPASDCKRLWRSKKARAPIT